jgi:hypothetical protein
MFKKLLPFIFLFAGFQVNAELIQWDISSMGQQYDSNMVGTFTVESTDPNTILNWNIVVSGTTQGKEYLNGLWKDDLAGHSTGYYGNAWWAPSPYDHMVYFNRGSTVLELAFDLSKFTTTGLTDFRALGSASGQSATFVSFNDTTASGSSLSFVPVPWSFSLFSLGLAGLAFSRRKKTRSIKGLSANIGYR